MRRNKYGAKRTIIDGINFHSKREAARYQQLKLLQMAGEITALELQPEYPIVIEGRPVLIRSEGYPKGRKAKYRADFRYRTKEGEIVIEDVKGFDTTEGRLRRAVVECIYGIEIKII